MTPLLDNPERWRPQAPAVLDLLNDARRTLPFIGAGVSHGTGLPDAAGLAASLAQSSLAAGVELPNPANLRDVVDRLRVGGVTRQAINQFVVERLDLDLNGARPSRAMRALVRTPSCIVVTLNYDLLLERAATLEGRAYESFTWRELPFEEDIEVEKPHDLFIVHLHGSVEDSDSLILDSESYRGIGLNADVRSFLGTLLAFHYAWFFGTSLDENYLVNHFQAARRRTPSHVLVDDEVGIAAATTGRGAILPSRARVYSEAFPAGRFDLLDEFCEYLVQPRARASEDSTVANRPNLEDAAASMGDTSLDAGLVLADFVSTDDWANKALNALTRSHASEAERLLGVMAAEGDAFTVAALINDNDSWVAEGSWELWVALARLAEQDGQWALAIEAWDAAAARTDEPDQQARAYVGAGGAADMENDAARRERFYQLAERADPANVRLAVRRAADIDDPSERLTALEAYSEEAGEVGALVHAHRAIARMQQDDIFAAEQEVDRARELDASLDPLKLIEANLAVHRARLAVATASPIDYADVANARERCLELRDRLLHQRRFGEATRMLMLAADGAVLVDGIRAAGKTLELVTEPELEAEHSLDILSEAALRSQHPELAQRWLSRVSRLDSSWLKRMQAQVDVLLGDHDRQVAGLAALDRLLLSGDDTDRFNAAMFRVSLNHRVAGANPSSRAEAILRQHGRAHVVSLFQALHEREHGDPERARELLRAHLNERWAAEAAMDWAMEDRDFVEAKRIAEQLLATGPDHTLRLQCAAVFQAAGDWLRARTENLTVAQNPSCGPKLRGRAYAGLVHDRFREEDFSEALRLCEEWARFAPQDPNQLWCRLRALYRLARHQDALQLMLDAELQPRDLQDARLAAALSARLPDGKERLRRVVELADQYDGDVYLERQALLLATNTPEVLSDDLVERTSLDRFRARFPDADPAVRTVDFDEVVAFIKQRAEDIEGAWAQVLDGELDALNFSDVVAKDVATAWSRMPVLPVGFGDEQLDSEELLAARDALQTGAMVDATAIATLGYLPAGTLDAVKRRLAATSWVTQSTLDDLDAGIDAVPAQDGQPAGDLTVQDGEVVRRVFTDEHRAHERARAEQALELARVFGSVPDLGANSSDEDRRLLEDTALKLRGLLGSLTNASQRSLGFYTDDRVVRRYLREDGFLAFGTRALLDALTEAGDLTEGERLAARRRLRERGAVGVTPSPDELADLYLDTSDTGRALHAALNDPAPWRADPGGHLLRALEFLRRVHRAASQRLPAATLDVLRAAIANVVLRRPGSAADITPRERASHHGAQLLVAAMLDAWSAEDPPYLLGALRPALRSALWEQGVGQDVLGLARLRLSNALQRAGAQPGLPIVTLLRLPLPDQLRIVLAQDASTDVRVAALVAQLPPARSRSVRTAPGASRRRRKKRHK